MKKILLWLLLSLSVWAQAATTTADAEARFLQALTPTAQETAAAHMAAEILFSYHYRAMSPDPDFSEEVFDRYLKSLDSEKLFLVQADIDQFAGDRASIAQKVFEEDLSVPFAIYDLYARRSVERFQYARDLLALGFDFEVDEELQLSRDLQPWSSSQAELDEVWRKRVKSDWLSLKLAGKKPQDIVATLDKRYARAIKHMGQTESTDAFQTFMNAYTMAIEPHTNYMGPRAAADFDISMRLSLVGIGIAVSDVGDFATIMELTEGGPASRSGQLHPGDRIVGVAQGEGGEMVDVVDWPADDLVPLLRGPEGTVVRLAVLPSEAEKSSRPKVVALERQLIGLANQAASSSIETVSEGGVARRIGVITLPSFYEDLAGKLAGEADFKSATRDVQQLLAEFKASHVDGVLVDLRDNGGGSLTQAIELTSLFVGNVPVVQQRNAAGEVVLGMDEQASVRWRGPLGVLINKRSASASEIFAAAIQDYGRGLIMGQASYGKGTVQSVIDLDQLVKNDKPELGELKMTIAQFFRVNGGTTQLRGVTPDVAFTGYFDEGASGEAAFDNALPWTMIKAVYSAPNASMASIVPALVAKHEWRTQRDAAFKQLQEDVAERQRQRDKNQISLNETERRQERAVLEAQMLARQADAEQASPATAESLATSAGHAAAGQRTTLYDGLLSGERSFEETMRAEQSAKDLKDIVLIEATQIVNDAIGMLQTARAAQAGQAAQTNALARPLERTF
jgi:carboxyl-terminal processing protease